MKHYDPDTSPVPHEWLGLDEHQRIALIERYHQLQRISLSNLRAHTAVHTIVENQAAECLPAVMQALYRLQDRGLSRHDAVHAVGQVAMRHLLDVMKQEGNDDEAFQARYAQALDGL